MIDASTAVLATADVTEAVRFYVDVLGFKQRWLYGDPPTFGCVGLDEVEIFLCQQPDLAGKVEGHMHYFFVDGDIDAFYARHRDSGAPIIEPIANKPWGLREYTVRDPSGYHLRFGETQQGQPKTTPSDPLPEWVRIEPQIPDLETYKSLFTSVGWAWDEPSMRDALTRTLAGVLATDTRDGQVIGMARSTGDGRYYMLWDVIVRPSHQGHNIGRAMVERVMDELKRQGAPQGAFVGLFTARPGFYERLGFKKDFAMHRQL
jgi:GNAT superfamily N-acetyltransferase/uncharacterized glyoxalase superfamily protein PhnB